MEVQLGLEQLPFVEKDSLKVTKNWALFRVTDKNGFRMDAAMAAVPAPYRVTGAKKGSAVP